MQITNGKIITPDGLLTDHTLVLEGSTIAAIVPAKDALADSEAIDAGGLWGAPGLTAVRVHGGGGQGTTGATAGGMQGRARLCAKHGGTRSAPTAMSAPAARTIQAMANVAAWRQPEDGAQHLGVHVEGPYLSI